MACGPWFEFASAAFDTSVQVCGLTVYKVQGRECCSGDWADVAMAMESEITLDGTTRASEFEFRAVAMNQAGEGEGTGEDSVWCKTRKALAASPSESFHRGVPAGRLKLFFASAFAFFGPSRLSAS